MNCRDGSFYEAWHFSRQDVRRARKPHQCTECKEVILIHTSYIHVVGRGDSGFCALDICVQCQDDWSSLMKVFDRANIDEHMVVYGSLEECVRKAFEDTLLKSDNPLAKRWIPEDEGLVGRANPLQIPLPI